MFLIWVLYDEDFEEDISCMCGNSKGGAKLNPFKFVLVVGKEP